VGAIGSYIVGVNDAALHKIDGIMIEIISKSLRLKEIIRLPKSRGCQQVGTGSTLVFKIMNGKADPHLFHPIGLIQLIEHYRRQPCLPIVTVDDLWPFVGPEQKLEGGFAERRRCR